MILRMSSPFISLVIALLGFRLVPGALAQETMVVQPFAGSAYAAQYHLEFDQLTAREGDKATFSERTLEGEVRGTVLIMPEGKSNLEILRSFEAALTGDYAIDPARLQPGGWNW